MLRSWAAGRSCARALIPRSAAGGMGTRARCLSQIPPNKIKQEAGEFNEFRERALLRHVIATATPDSPTSVVAAMDTFWDTYFNGEGTAEWQLRGKALEDAILAKSPTNAMEIGTYCGYTAVKMGQFIPAGGRLISLEIDPLYAAIATKVVEHAGLSDRVVVEIGSIQERLEALQKKYSLNGSLDAVLLDHDVSCYLPDLQLLQTHGLVTTGTVVLCDWSLYPGSDADQAPTDGTAFMKYLAETGNGPTTRHTLRDKEVFTVSSWQGVV